MENKISIYIVENYDLTRALLKQVLSNEFNLLGEFSDEDSCFNAFKDIQSDVILMDLKFPYKKSFNFIDKIKTKYPDTKIIILSAIDDEEIMYTSAVLGVSGYILKDIDFNTLKETIKQIHIGKMCFQMKEEIKTLV